MQTYRKHLPHDVVRAIRKDGRHACEIAEAYGLPLQTVSNIIARRTYINVLKEDGETPYVRGRRKGRKLTDAQVIEIRSMQRVSRAYNVARRFNVTAGTIYAIWAGSTRASVGQ